MPVAPSRKPTKKRRIKNTVFPNDELNVFLEHADESGFVAERELASIAAEHDLDEDELAALRAELETRGVEIVPEEPEPSSS